MKGKNSSGYGKKWGTLPFLLFLLIAGNFYSCIPSRSGFTEDPFSYEEHMELASVYEKMGNMDLALKHYRDASIKMKNRPEPFVRMGDIHYINGNFNEAKKNYEKAFELGHRDARLLNNLAYIIVLTGGDLNRAESLINESLRIGPEKPYLYFDTLALIYIKKGKFRDAEKLLRDIINEARSERNEVLSEIYLHYGIALKELGKIDESREAFQRCINLNPSSKAANDARKYLNTLP